MLLSMGGRLRGCAEMRDHIGCVGCGTGVYASGWVVVFVAGRLLSVAASTCVVAPRCAINAVSVRLISSILSSSASILLSIFSNLLSTLSSSLSIRLSMRPMFMLNVVNEYPSIAIISAVRKDWSGCSTILRHAVAILVVSPAVPVALAGSATGSTGCTLATAFVVMVILGCVVVSMLGFTVVVMAGWAAVFFGC